MKAVQTKRSDERYADRFAVTIETEMRELGMPNVSVRIDNISTQGFGGRCFERFMRPCVVAVELPGVGPVKARVVWTGDDTVGGEFLVPLELEKLDCELGERTRGGI